ncbi:MAG: class I SAM-dependent methyltransferase [Pseudomonadota bacterium]|jgi:2-polyprenyl-3-methyl-5-hydroxy-6-metoxy-1,4-benzoquinol methylase
MLSILSQPHDAPVHERYNFKPLRGSSHWWALSHLTESVAGKHILDVGAGGGGIGKAIRPQGPEKLIAVEIDTRAHPVLRQHYDMVISDISSVSQMRFDWIILLDVLEHLPKPLEYLQGLQKLLNPGGRILISVPNVAHWSVRFPLFFFGSFEYQARGIMDGTHLQFFCRKTFLRLCRSLPETNVAQLSSSIEPFELALPKWISNNPIYRGLIPIRLRLACLLPGLMAYQHLALLRSKD